MNYHVLQLSSASPTTSPTLYGLSSIIQSAQVSGNVAGG